ncbi:RHS repeat domain-containing protein [Frateuria hangzhouensis]|uniref:RHS repeat domain-containing protein n=1 Tax=Frateuria hangzhouensis TaxID=2995589 RepID=UPI0022609A0E|nr:RHS repeat-associated core domain-containing protein [Frateuria sp. STR12]MCX7513171.1 RHS repeat-associated core domain-containing protein [Frateuria sp. STR12]
MKGWRTTPTWSRWLRQLGGGLLLATLACLHPAQAAETSTYVLTDDQGTVLMLTDNHGNPIARFDHRPYGQQSGPVNAGPGYTGHVEDPDTGLVYMQQRYYDPEVGRFLSVDPIVPAPNALMSFNRYQYAENDPISNLDPTGMCGEVSGEVQKMRNLSDVSMGGMVHCFVSPEGQKDFGTTLSQVPGFDESGEASYRASNDWAFISAAMRYDLENGYGEGDDGYMSPYTLKAWSMVESGSTRDRMSFLSDPLQVNNAGDWSADKIEILGLSKGQQMTPYTSAYAAMQWWRHKGFVHDRMGREMSWRGDIKAFERYNGNSRMDKSLDGAPVPHAVWYANEVLRLKSGM